MTNTEKPSTKAEQKKNIVNVPKQEKQKVIQAPIKKDPVENKVETVENKEVVASKDVPSEKSEGKEKVPEKSSETKEKKAVTPKIKKDHAIVNAKGVPISAKYSKAICKFIKYKSIPKAIRDLEDVLTLKKAVPMKGEIPHRKGKIMSGRFPIRATKHFIILLKSLQGNATMHELENPIIVQAISNIGQQPAGKGGIRRKRTHLTIKAMEKKVKKEKKVEKGDKK